MNIIPFLKNYNLSDEDKTKLNTEIYNRIALETDLVKNPFKLKNGVWIMNKYTQKEHYPSFPSGGYITENQAQMALTIHQINLALDYRQLYLLSLMITVGI